MAYSIQSALHEWMQQRRIITVVAQIMGKNPVTLSAELRPSCSQAKLGADDLIPLFDAIRKAGYGRELDGLIHRYVEELQGAVRRSCSGENLVSQVLALTASLGTLSACAANVQSMTDETELQRLALKLRTELLPVVLRMEALIHARLQAVRKKEAKRNKGLLPLQPLPES